MKIYPLRYFVKRVLLIRLIAATAIIAAVVGFAAYSVQRAKLGSQVIDLGRRGIATLVDRVRFTMEQKQIDGLSALRELTGRGEPPVVYRAGRFVAFQIYDRKGSVLSDASVKDTKNMPAIQAFLSARPHNFPDPGEEEALQVTIAGAGFVYIATPVSNPTGDIVAYARGLFAVSPEMTAEMRNALFRSVFLAIAIVIAVAAILYPVILHLMSRLADYSSHLLDANLETLSVLGSAIAKRDSDTDAHNYRVSLYSAKIGEAMGLPVATMRELIKGAFLHDVGKIGIPDDILLKPGKLDENEFSEMKTHVEKGMDIISRSSWLRDSVAVVGNHHEKYGGGGYPGNLRENQSPSRPASLPWRMFSTPSHRFGRIKNPFLLKRAWRFSRRGAVPILIRKFWTSSPRWPGTSTIGMPVMKAMTFEGILSIWSKNIFPREWKPSVTETVPESF